MDNNLEKEMSLDASSISFPKKQNNNILAFDADSDIDDTTKNKQSNKTHFGPVVLTAKQQYEFSNECKQILLAMAIGLPNDIANTKIEPFSCAKNKRLFLATQAILADKIKRRYARYG
jgi:hypothetical protein